MNFGMFLAVGKPGKKPAFPSRELMANERGRDNHFAALIWSDDARGSLVDPTALGLSRIVDFYCLFDVGCVSGCTLFLRQLHFTVYSPEIFCESPHSWFGTRPLWWPSWLVFSPALLVLWAPGGFRLTCYYYPGAYYKSFLADP